MESFTKKLSNIDVERRLLLPENCLKNVPRGQETYVKFRDEDGIVWTFRCRIPPGPEGHSRPAISGDWFLFVRRKGLKVGDIIVIVFHTEKDRGASSIGDHFEIKVKKTTTRN